MKNLSAYTCDPADPAAGQRLQLGLVCAELKVSVADLAELTGLAKTTAFKLMSNEWPARSNDQERARLREQIEAGLAERGATPQQLATLWHAHLGKGPRAIAAQAAAATRPSRAGTHTHLADAPAGTPPTPEEPDMLLPKQSLSPQARRHFKLFTNPFDGEVLTDEAMFDSGDIRWVREACWQASQLGGFVAVVGESGAGKTTIVTDLEARIARDGRPVVLIKPGVLGMEGTENVGHMLKSTDILHAVINTLQPDSTVPQTLQARTVRAHKLLLASAETGAMHLLVIEEAHGLPDSTLKHLKRLHELRRGRTSLLGILLVGQPELKLRLANGLRTGGLREVAQRCEVVELLPLDAALGDYLRCRAQAASVQLDTLMEPKAVDALRARLTRRVQGGAVSMCYPLAVNNMMTKALNAAAGTGAPMVTADLMAAC